jgi:hypothetical protein
MPIVTVTFVDGTSHTYRPQVARFGGVDLQLSGDPEHWPVLDVRRSQFIEVDVDGYLWRWDGHQPQTKLEPATRTWRIRWLL